MLPDEGNGKSRADVCLKNGCLSKLVKSDFFPPANKPTGTFAHTHTKNTYSRAKVVRKNVNNKKSTDIKRRKTTRNGLTNKK